MYVNISHKFVKVTCKAREEAILRGAGLAQAAEKRADMNILAVNAYVQKKFRDSFDSTLHTHMQVTTTSSVKANVGNVDNKVEVCSLGQKNIQK